MLENNKLGKLSDVEWLHKFLAMYEKWNQKYYEAVRYCCEGEDRIPFYNPVEQRLLVYEVLGYLISYAYYLSFRREYDRVAGGRCYEVHASIILNNAFKILISIITFTNKIQGFSQETLHLRSKNMFIK